MKNLLPFLILASTLAVFGQKSVADLEPQHRDALAKYVTTRAAMSLRLETIVDREYLTFMAEGQRPSFAPNYVVGDFNGDKKKDFAVLLTRPGKPRNVTPGENQSSEHFPDFPLHLVLFNGGPRSAFKPVFTLNFYAPRAGFLHFDEKRKRLYFEVSETDWIFSLLPRGSGYRVKNEGL